MSKLNKSQKRLLVVLLAVLAYAVYDIAGNWKSYTGFYTGKKTAAAEKTKTASGKETVKKTGIRPYEQGWKSDPFYVKVAETAPRKKTVRREMTLNLKAISYAGESSVAMINDRIMSVGDVIGGYKVLKIEPRRVILGKGAKSKVLALK